MNISYLILPFVFLMVSCVGASTSNEDYKSLIEAVKKQKLSEIKSYVVDGVIEPYFPDDEKNNSTIAGVDSNNDGIRDDIEIYINRNSKTRNARMALRQFAKYLQKEIVEAEEATPEQALKTITNTEKSSDCYMFTRDVDDKAAVKMISNVRNLTYGNSMRNQVQTILSRKLIGKAIGSDIPLGHGYKGCEFNIDNFEEILKKRSKE